MKLPVNRILCATDFSGHSTSAFHYALAIASWFNAEVAVVHVHRPDVQLDAAPAYAGPEGLGPFLPSDLERGLVASRVRAFVQIESCHDPRVSWHLDESRDVAEAIVDRARMLQADLIVMGTHGRTGVRRAILGSVTERVLRTAPCAVMAIPPHAQRLPANPPLARILCATDFSAAADCALEWAVDVANHVDATLTVAHIIELPTKLPGSTELDLTPCRKAGFEQAEASLSAALARFVTKVATNNILRAGQPGPELLRLSREQHSDLMVMGVHGRSGGDLMLFGSVAQHVMRRAACPVLAVPAPPRQNAALGLGP